MIKGMTVQAAFRYFKDATEVYKIMKGMGKADED